MRDNAEYERIATLAAASGFKTKRDVEGFYNAWKQATESTFGGFQLGCVIMCGGQIVGSGYNTIKSDPTQKMYNIKHRPFEPGEYSNREHSLHAEMAALKSIPYPVQQQLNWKKARAYVFRISPGKPFGQGIAAPCCACAHALADVGIRRVLFSTDYGFAESRLDAKAGLLIPESELIVARM